MELMPWNTVAAADCKMTVSISEQASNNNIVIMAVDV